MGLFDHFPYTNFHELNLAWILNALNEIQTTMDQFVSLNALKYADPIQWNIVSQYEKNTIVIDPLTGIAYISVQPVPSGVIITNTDYWSVVFDLSGFIIRAAKNFCNNYEPDSTLIATFASNVDDWLVYGDVLYRVIAPISIGDYYVIGTNIVHFSMEDIVGHVTSLNTTDKSNLVAAINELLLDIGDLDTLLTTDQSSIVAAANEIFTIIMDNIRNDIYYVTPEMFGAVGDGITDDTAAFTAALAYPYVKLHKKEYYISGNLSITSPCKVLDGNSATLHCDHELQILNDDNFKVCNLKLYGSDGAGINFEDSNMIRCENVFVIDVAGTGIAVTPATQNVYNALIKDCTVENCAQSISTGIGIYFRSDVHYVAQSRIIDCTVLSAGYAGIFPNGEDNICDGCLVNGTGLVYPAGAYGIWIHDSRNTIVSNCEVQHTARAAYSIIKACNTLISNCVAHDTTMRGYDLVYSESPNGRYTGDSGNENAILDSCIFYNCGATANTYSGIEVHGFRRVTITNCKCTSPASWEKAGIELFKSDQGNVDIYCLEIDNCDFTNCGTGVYTTSQIIGNYWGNWTRGLTHYSTDDIYTNNGGTDDMDLPSNIDYTRVKEFKFMMESGDIIAALPNTTRGHIITHGSDSTHLRCKLFTIQVDIPNLKVIVTGLSTYDIDGTPAVNVTALTTPPKIIRAWIELY